MLKEILHDRKMKKIKEQRRKEAKKLAIGAFSGIAAGIASGLLFAPKSGKEARKEIAEKTSEVNSKIKENAANVKNNVKDKQSELKSNISEAREKISTYLAEKKSKAAKDETCTQCEETASEEVSTKEENPQGDNSENK